MVGESCLLDTSTIVWALASPDRLSSAARKAISSKSLVLSVVAYWEIVIKSKKGLIEIPDPVIWWTRATDFLGGTVVAIRAKHISALSALPDIHKDPFDLILVAQAVAEGFTLITSDSQIRRYSVKTLW